MDCGFALTQWGTNIFPEIAFLFLNSVSKVLRNEFDFLRTLKVVHLLTMYIYLFSFLKSEEVFRENNKGK